MKIWRHKIAGFYFVKDWKGFCYIGYDKTTDLSEIFPHDRLQQGMGIKTNRDKFADYIEKNGWMVVVSGWNRKIDVAKFDQLDNTLSITTNIKAECKLAYKRWKEVKKNKKAMLDKMRAKQVHIETIVNNLKDSSPVAVDDDYKVTVN